MAGSEDEQKITDYLRNQGPQIEELDMLDLSSISDDRVAQARFLAEQLDINPSTFEGEEGAALPFLKGLAVYTEMDRLERNFLLETLSKIWGTSAFVGEVTTAASTRIAIPGVEGVTAKSNNELVRDYVMYKVIGDSIGIVTQPTGSLEFFGAVGTALGSQRVTNWVVTGAAGAQANASRLALLNKLGRRAGPALLVVAASERHIAHMLSAHDTEVQRRIDGESQWPMTLEELERLVERHGGQIDKTALQ